jgi:salicylate hydroxylase
LGDSNGLNGVPLKEQTFVEVAPQYRGQRVRRTRLQAALIAKVPEGAIKLRKRLVSLNNIDEGGARLVFEDGEEVIANLVIGADGIRSVCFLSFLCWWLDNVLGGPAKCFPFPCYQIHW